MYAIWLWLLYFNLFRTQKNLFRTLFLVYRLLLSFLSKSLLLQYNRLTQLWPDIIYEFLDCCIKWHWKVDNLLFISLWNRSHQWNEWFVNRLPQWFDELNIGYIRRMIDAYTSNLKLFKHSNFARISNQSLIRRENTPHLYRQFPFFYTSIKM